MYERHLLFLFVCYSFVIWSPCNSISGRTFISCTMYIQRTIGIANMIHLSSNKASIWSSKWETKPDNSAQYPLIIRAIIALILLSKINISDWWWRDTWFPYDVSDIDQSIRGGYSIQTAVRVDAYAVLIRIKGSVSNYLEHTLDVVSVAIGLSYGQSGWYDSTQWLRARY